MSRHSTPRRRRATSSTRPQAVVFALLALLGLLLLAVSAGCKRGEAIAHERGVERTATAAEGTETARPDGRQALRDGKALGKIDRIFSNPMGGTKID